MQVAAMEVALDFAALIRRKAVSVAHKPREPIRDSHHIIYRYRWGGEL